MSATLEDQSAVYFDIPATDPLGRMHVTGKLLAAPDRLALYWRLKDNAFRGGSGEMQHIPIDYLNVESLQFRAVLGKWKPRLVLKINDPAPMAELPGASVGGVILHLTGRTAKADARSLLKMVDYRKSEADANARITRISDLTNTGGL